MSNLENHVRSLSDKDLLRHVNDLRQGARGFWCLLTDDGGAAKHMSGRLRGLGVIAVVENTSCMNPEGKRYGVYVASVN